MADISKITLPSGTTYFIKDEIARQMISQGVSFTISTNASTTPAGVTWDNNGQTVTGTLTATADTTGVFYMVPMTTVSGKDVYAEYVTVQNGNNYSWEKIGTTDIDLSNLGALAYKDTASGSYTPAGTIAINASTAEEGTSFTPYGIININDISSGSGTAYTPAGTIGVNASNQTGTSYTPEGSISAPTISVETAGSTQSITPFGSAGTLPTLSMTVTDENLTVSFSQGTLPSAGTAVTVKTGDAEYSASAPSFTGVEKKLAFTGATKKFAFTGTARKIAFVGTQGNVTVS